MTSLDMLFARSNNQIRKYKSGFSQFFLTNQNNFCKPCYWFSCQKQSDSWMAGNSNYEILFYKILVTYKSSSVIMESWWWLLDCDSPKHWSWHYTVVILKINNPQFGKIFFSKSFDVYYLMDLSRLITERAHNSIEINILSWTIFFSTIEKHQVKAQIRRQMRLGTYL